MRIGWVAGTTSILLVTKGLDNDGVVKRACILPSAFVSSLSTPTASSNQGLVSNRTFPGRIQRLHIEDVDSLHLSQDFQPL